MTWLSPDERSNLQYPFTAQGLALKQQHCIPVTVKTQISWADHCPHPSSHYFLNTLSNVGDPGAVHLKLFSTFAVVAFIFLQLSSFPPHNEGMEVDLRAWIYI